MGTPVAHAPARLGRYELLARLATGGMGEIFLARLEGAAGFEKLFVVKRILPHLADDARFRQMLIAEARIASRLSHANICQVYELGETDGQLYIVMEYMEGIELLPMLRRAAKAQTRLELGLVGAVIQQAADALHYAHELRDRDNSNMGIVHRDVTPSNIFVTESGVAKVLDFGIAKVKDASSNTQTGTVKGKYAYMAPEQLKGGGIDRRADVFTLGVVAFEMVALRRLFQRKTDYLTFRAVMEEPIADIRRYRPDVPEALAQVLSHALDRDPDQRFATARQFGTAIVDALTPVQRPWSQGEVSDYVRATFADVLTKRHHQVASAVHRTNPAGAVPSQLGRTTMPLIAQDDAIEEPRDDDDDDEFPAVETEFERESAAPPTTMRLPGSASAMTVTDFQGATGQTPPPFSAETSASGASIQPLPVTVGTLAAVAPAARRSLVWPLLAVAMVAIAAGALVLVYQQMQSQQHQQNQNPIIIQQGPANRGPASTDSQISDGAITQLVATGSGGTSDHTAEGSGDPGSGGAGVIPRPRQPPKPKDPYSAAVRSRSAEINQCGQAHGIPPKNASVTIVIAPSGRAKTITLEPAALDASPLGSCIKNVLSGVSFPPAKQEMKVAVTLHVS